MKQNKLLAALFFSIGVLLSVVFLFIYFMVARVNRECTVEQGTTLVADEFRRFSWDKGNFRWVEQPDLTSPGEKKAKIEVYPIIYHVTVIVTEAKSPDITKAPTQTPVPTVAVITDITAPIVNIQKVIMYAEDYISGLVLPQQFIISVEEESEYSVQALEQSSDLVLGDSSYLFEVTDTAGNSTSVEAELLVLNLKKELTLELGSKMPDASEFQYSSDGPSVSFKNVSEIAEINGIIEGSYEISFLVDGVEAVSVLHIKDTTPPELVLKTAETWLNKPLEINDFVDFEQSYDNSEVFNFVYVNEPDWSAEGEQIVQISATDVFGNSVIKDTALFIKKDIKAPVVSVTDIDIKVGGNVSYKKAVTYYDDIDSKDEMKLSVERSKVNLKEVGTYEVTYTVTDCSGNATSVVGKINVLNEAPKWEDEQVIHEKAQSVLNSIINEGMSDREKARAIYKWLKNNIGYISHSEKGNYIRGAYEGLFKYQGDCFVYASAAKELLTLAGIRNIDIVKATTNPSHYWNLVYIEDGWYHFDSTPRKDKSEFFLLTDAELEAYSSTHNNTHIFDRSLYPEIK